MDQCNRTEPRHKLTHLCQLIFDKGGKNIQWRKEGLFCKWCWERWRTACKSKKLEYTLTIHTQINSNWLKDLNIRHDTIKLLEKNISKAFSDINCTNVFLAQSPVIWNKSKNRQMETNQTYKLLHSKENHKHYEKIIYELWKKYLQMIPLTGASLPKYTSSSYNSITTTTKQPNQKMDRRPSHFSREDIQMPNRHVKRHSTLLIIREI